MEDFEVVVILKEPGYDRAAEKALKMAKDKCSEAEDNLPPEKWSEVFEPEELFFKTMSFTPETNRHYAEYKYTFYVKVRR